MASQFDEHGRLKHLLTLEGVKKETYLELFSLASSFIDPETSQTRRLGLLRDRLVVNAFFEPSTRTRLSFEIAARSLGAEVVNFDLLSSSTVAKGETFEDTLCTIAALGADFIILRHGEQEPSDQLLDILPEDTSLVNGGEGSRDHPSQGLLDAWTIMLEKGGFEGLRIAVVGDIVHSRVARSLAHAFAELGVSEFIACGPPELVPESLADELVVKVEHNADAAVDGVDVIICLRFQYERMNDGKQRLANEAGNEYTIDKKRVGLASPDVMVMHPGPINRGVEITDEVADGPRSFILRQVTNGIAMRMAILSKLGQAEGRN